MLPILGILVAFVFHPPLLSWTFALPLCIPSKYAAFSPACKKGSVMSTACSPVIIRIRKHPLAPALAAEAQPWPNSSIAGIT